MATIYTSDSLRNIFQSSFNLTQWYSFSQHFFNVSELKKKPERIIENTSDEGYYLGNIILPIVTVSVYFNITSQKVQLLTSVWGFAIL